MLPPASEGSYGIKIFSNFVRSKILPFANELRAHPPVKHKFFDQTFL